MRKANFYLSTVLLALLALLLGWLVVFTEGRVLAEEPLEWTQFLGRFHPVILHLPIGLFFGLFTIELLALRKNSEGLNRSAHILVWLMALTSVLTAYLGLLLASNGDYSGDTLWLHKWLGILFAAAALLVTFCKVLSCYSEGKGVRFYRLLMLGLCGLLPVVGHYGGNLTHGKGYLVAYAPEWLKAIIEAPEETTVEVVDSVQHSDEGNQFTQQIQPMLDQYCVQCHGVEKQKSKYRLDTYEYLMTPGSMGDTPIVPYRISESILLEYMLLPEADDMAMPPEGKPRPSAEELLLFTHWVANGAEGPPVDEVALAAEETASEAEQAKINQLISRGIMVLPLSLESDLLYVDFQNARGAVEDEDFDLLAEFKDRIAELKITGVEVSSQQLESLRGAAALRILNLTGLASADSAMDILNSFSALETLNLFGSDLTDTGLSRLSLPDAGSLYLGSTNVTPQQLNTFEDSHPGVQVYGDVDLDEVYAIEAIDLANTAEFNPEKKK
ncbi:MAG: c-type cytochrome domain-containing protein [Opitutaceae bacterium]